jgi:hypothetical protein
MAAYPSHNILLGSSQDLEVGHTDDITESGIQYSRALHASQYYHFSLLHQLTGTQFEALLAAYAAGPRDTYTLTYRVESPAITYSVKFLGPPKIQTNLGGGQYIVQVSLRGTKD